MADSAERVYRDNPDVAHEASDVDVKAILGFAAALAVTAVVIHIALYGLLRFYEHRETRRASPVIAQPKEERPEPRLQVSPRADLAALRRAEERLLHSYGWVDREKNIARVPIERAMEMVVQKGLPARKQARPESDRGIGKKPPVAGGQDR